MNGTTYSSFLMILLAVVRVLHTSQLVGQLTSGAVMRRSRQTRRLLKPSVCLASSASSRANSPAQSMSAKTVPQRRATIALPAHRQRWVGAGRLWPQVWRTTRTPVSCPASRRCRQPRGPAPTGHMCQVHTVRRCKSAATWPAKTVTALCCPVPSSGLLLRRTCWQP